MVQTVDAYFQHFFQSALFCALSTHAHTTQVCTQHTGALNIHITCTEHIHARTHVHSQHMCTTTHRNIHVVLEAKNACLACICRVDGHTQLAWCALGQGVLHHGVWLKHPGGLEHITTFSVHRKLSSGTSESVCMRERERVCVYIRVCVRPHAGAPTGHSDEVGLDAHRALGSGTSTRVCLEHPHMFVRNVHTCLFGTSTRSCSERPHMFFFGTSTCLLGTSTRVCLERPHIFVWNVHTCLVGTSTRVCLERPHVFVWNVHTCLFVLVC